MLARKTGTSNEGVPLVVGTSEIEEFSFGVRDGTSTCNICGEWDGVADVLFGDEYISVGDVEGECGSADVISLLGVNDGAIELDSIEFVGGELGDAIDDIVGRAMDINVSQSSLLLTLMIS